MDCGQVLEPAIDTAREIVLISNVLCVYLPLVCKDVYVSDFIILQALKVLSPAMYQWIRNNKRKLVPNEKKVVVNPSNAYQDREPFYKELKESVNYDSRYDGIIKRLLGFPPFNTNETSRSFCTEFFDRYFVYEIADKSPKTEDIQNLSKLIIDKDEKTVIDAFNGMYSKYGEEGSKIAIDCIASKGTPLQQSPEGLILLVRVIAMFYKNHYLDNIVLDNLPVRWDMEIVRILNLLAISVVDTEGIMSELKNIQSVSNLNFYVSILLCYYKDGVYHGTKEFKGLVANFMCGMSPIYISRGFMFEMNSRAIRLFYPIFKNTYSNEFCKMISGLYDPKALNYLLLIVKAFFGTIQADEKLELSYNSYKELFDVKKTYQSCNSSSSNIYIEMHPEIKTGVDRFKKLYLENDAEKVG